MTDNREPTGSDTSRELAEAINESNEVCQTCGFHCSDRLKRSGAVELIKKHDALLVAAAMERCVDIIEKFRGWMAEDFEEKLIKKIRAAIPPAPAAEADPDKEKR